MKHPVPNGSRRLLLGGALAGSAFSALFSFSIFDALASTPAPAAAPAAAPASFVTLSQWLSGRDALHPTQAARLYAALVDSDTDFVAQLAALTDFIAQKKPDPAALQAALDAEKAPFAALPRRILTAWYVGVVGSGKAARCITYETSLMAVAVADRLKPPSYAYGPYGSWSANPLATA